MFAAFMVFVASILLIWGGVTSFNAKDYILAFANFFTSFSIFSLVYSYFYNESVYIILTTNENIEMLEVGMVLRNDSFQYGKYAIITEKVSATEIRARTLKNYEIVLMKLRIKFREGARL